MKYVAYLDESGTHAGSENLVVAGYLALADEWIAFETEWRTALAEYGIESFHMTDFSNAAPPFNGCSDAVRQSCLQKLVSVTNRHAWGGFYLTISLAAYRRTITPGADKWLGGPYGLAMVRCFFEMGDALVKVDPARQISYVLEDGARGKGQVLKVFELNKNKPELGLIELTFANKTRFVPLQAADILAYEVYRARDRQLSSKGILRPQLQHILELPILGGVMTESDMAGWARVAEVGITVNPHMSRKQARKLRSMHGP